MNLLIAPIIIPLTNGGFTLVSREDFDKVTERRWYGSFDKNGKRYVFNTKTIDNTKNTMLRLHRFILDAPKNMQVDHINMNTLDNRRENLRLCDASTNGMNRLTQINNTSGYKGVYLTKTDKHNGKKWWAYIWVNKKRISLGMHRTKEEAKIVRDKATLQYHGEFARLD